MNTFELKIIDSDEIPFALTSKPPGVITQQIWIDGAHLDEPHVVDVRELVRSLFKPGEYYFFTCECGESGCAGIWDGFKVRHVPGKILWHFRRPVSQKGNDLDEDDEFDQWVASTTAIEYAFDREQFTSAIDYALRELKSRPEKSEYSPYGFDREQLEKLDAYHQPSLDWREEPGRRRLYFLADEDNPLFLEGQFISVDRLGVSERFEADFIEWKCQSNQASPLSPDQRNEWLEKTRSLLLSSYQEGLPADIDIWLVVFQWTTNGELDSWSSQSRLISRWFLNKHSAFEDPYLCLSADKGGFSLWFDFTPEPKNERYRFLGSHNRIYDGCPFKIPFALEKALTNWASSMPEYKTPGPWDRWLLGRPESSAQLGDFDWATFHAEGVRLATEIKGLVGNQVTVFYEVPWRSPAIGEMRRLEING